MKEDLKNKIAGIKSTVKDAFEKGSDAFNKQVNKQDVSKDQTKTDFNKKVDQLKSDQDIGTGRKAS